MSSRCVSRGGGIGARFRRGWRKALVAAVSETAKSRGPGTFWGLSLTQASRLYALTPRT